jgi:hypothetical protein
MKRNAADINPSIFTQTGTEKPEIMTEEPVTNLNKWTRAMNPNVIPLTRRPTFLDLI